jgi:hypothetical protein
MKKLLSGFAGIVALAAFAALAAPAQAQAQSTQWWEWAAPLVVGGEQIPTRGGVIVIPEPRGDRGARGRGGARARGNGPAFCRSGEGHPVHGRRWCIDKGWGLGSRGQDRRWERRRWDDVVFRQPRDRRRSGALDEPTLIETLGRVVFGRLQGHGQQLGAQGPLTGRWIAAGPGSGQVLQLRSGGVPIAELTDLDGDGRVDLVLVYSGN